MFKIYLWLFCNFSHDLFHFSGPGHRPKATENENEFASLAKQIYLRYILTRRTRNKLKTNFANKLLKHDKKLKRSKRKSWRGYNSLVIENNSVCIGQNNLIISLVYNSANRCLGLICMWISTLLYENKLANVAYRCV